MFYWQNSCDKRQIYSFNELCKQKRLEVPMKLYREYKVKRNLEIKAYVGLLAPFLPIKLL